MRSRSTKRCSSLVARQLAKTATAPTATTTTTISVMSRRKRKLWIMFVLGEFIADAIDRLDIQRPCRVRLDLLAQIHHMHIDGALEPLVVEAEHLLQQLQPAERAPRLLDQRLQQLELLGRQAQRRPGQPSLMPDEIDDQIAKPHGRRAFLAFFAGPPQHYPHPRDDLTRAERLGD